MGALTLRVFYRRRLRPLVPWVSALVVILLLISLYLLADALRSSTRYESLYLWLLGFNVVGVLFLLGVVVANLWRLVQSVRAHVPGARLTTRFLGAFVALSLAPVAIVFYFSLDFIQRGIDSWFDVRIEQALGDALELSRASLEVRMREALRVTTRVSGMMADTDAEHAALELDTLRRETEATEMTLFGAGNMIIASASDDTQGILPARPSEAMLMHVRQGNDYIGLEPAQLDRLVIRVLTPMRGYGLNSGAGSLGDPEGGRTGLSGLRSETWLLQAMFPVDPRLATLATSVQDAFHQYRELIYLRHGLKQNFALALGLALLLSALTAVWLAFVAARRLSAPIRELALGTRAVAAGDYSLRLPVQRNDDLGLLVRSFNTMTARIAESTEEAHRLKEDADAQRDYLETVLQHLSSGVLTLDEHAQVRHANAAAATMLGVSLDELQQSSLHGLCLVHAHLNPLCEALHAWLDHEGVVELGQEVRLFSESGRRILMLRGAPLAHDMHSGEEGGLVLVMDDITAIIQGQRDAAWSEVARRLAHEIKNPLTPIQLSAERLRRRLGPVVGEEDGKVLERATHTIVQQVEAMKHMVNEFAEYARTPEFQLEKLDLNALVRDVVDLYRGGAVRVRRDLAEQPLWVDGDTGRLRQLLHNLVKNAVEALQESGVTSPAGPTVTLRTRLRADEDGVELCVGDNGPGFPPELVEHIFEPYVTTRPKGTGLGLAIVKKIVEEHAGRVHAFNPAEGGARVLILLPAAAVPS
ncbi:MAG: HAMP domain-containing protein [Halothiobacillaceae bacterium]|nr:MAG: HAMP domain-containing protein [Halothiobacillaceae bacterium]